MRENHERNLNALIFSNILEGKKAGIISVGVVEGSSVMGLSQEEYFDLSDEQKFTQCQRVIKIYKKANADYIIQNMSNLISLIEEIES